MEVEALTAIFDTAFEIVSDTSPFVWSVKLLPVDCGGDEAEEEKENHIAIKLVATIPPLYPDDKPELDVKIIKGLADPQRKEILKIAEDEADANQGMAAIYAICEAVREWMVENNVKGQDDGSMYAQMMRRAKDVEKAKAQAEQKFESQKKQEGMSKAELEELAVRKRREEGTPCTKEHFESWLVKFDAEMKEKETEDAILSEKESLSKKKEKGIKAGDDRTGRLSGFEQFSGNNAMVSMDAIEAAVDQIAEGDVDEELFDDDDDLDDLDFDSEDSEEDTPDI